MMDRKGQWNLSPAYDLCHSEGSDFTCNHQLSFNGKACDTTMMDLKYLAGYAGLPKNRKKPAVEEVGVPNKIREHVCRTLRLRWR